MSEQVESIPQKKRVNWLISEALLERVALHAQKTKMGVQEAVEDLLDTHIPKYKIVTEESNDAAA